MSKKIIINPKDGFLKTSKRVLKLATPIIASNLLYTVESTISILLVSEISPSAVAAVGFSGSMLWFIYSLMALSYTGTTVLVAQRVGANKDPSPALFWGILISLLIATPLTFYGEELLKTLMRALGGSQDVISLSEEYLKPIFTFIAVGFVVNTIYAAYNGFGDTSTPFRVAVLMSLINLTISYILVNGKFGFEKLGVAGAGWGIAISEIAGFFTYLALYVFKSKPFKVRFSPYLEVLREIFKIGAPSALERALTSLSFNVFVGMVAIFGDRALAAHQIGLRVESASFMVGFGMMIASSTISGQNFGAKNYKGIEYGVWVCAHLGAILMSIISVPLVIFAKPISAFFSNDPEVIRYSIYYLTIVALSQAPMAYASVLSGSLKGMGKTHLPLFVNLGSFWVFRIIPSMALIQTFPTPILPWIFMSIETALRAIIFYIVFKKVLNSSYGSVR
ncbi:MAG: MATE family efflux transporter [Aquificaceae bacterium]|nr:MATE family efflux transporter [Aquificaceae bacterium]MDW8237625.1 MATE family efflux transporter [Aquificaceae bacterium]